VINPPVINGVSVIELTSVTATVSYTANYSTSDLLEVKIGGSWVTKTNHDAITDLTPNTVYEYRITATDGTRTATHTGSFRTAPTVAPSGYQIGGEVTDNGNPPDITVTLERGNTVIAVTTVTGGGTYLFSFTNVPNGVYNLVCDNGSYKVTQALTVSGEAQTDISINMESGKTQSVVEIKSVDTPPVAVGGLPELFEKTSEDDNEGYTADDADYVSNAGGTVEIKLAVEKISASVDAAAIESAATGQTVGLYVDLSVIKSRINADGVLESETKLTGLSSLLTVTFELPQTLSGKTISAIYRAHGGAVDTISKDPANANADGEYFTQNGNIITLYACKFSTYALAYTNTTTPPGGATSNTDSTPEPNDKSDVSKLLITDIHIAYVNGQGDGKFAPEASMTRAEAAQMLYNLLRDKDTAIAKTFTDVPTAAWYAEAVNVLASMGTISGIGDGKFEPERNITRAEFATLLVRFAEVSPGEARFDDVPSTHWAYDYVSTASAFGWVIGLGYGRFEPDRGITRAEAVTLMNRVLGRSPDKAYIESHAEVSSFTDVPSDYWAYYDIAEAATAHDYDKNNGDEVWKTK